MKEEEKQGESGYTKVGGTKIRKAEDGIEETDETRDS